MSHYVVTKDKLIKALEVYYGKPVNVVAVTSEDMYTGERFVEQELVSLTISLTSKHREYHNQIEEKEETHE